MVTYRSLVPGGFFSQTPLDKKTGPVSVRMNNPGAVNGAAWERTYPGYVGEVETTPGNKSTIFEAPEYGVAVWYELMKKYRAADACTVEEIIDRYGGGQDYSSYAASVAKKCDLDLDSEILLEGDDDTLLDFAKAMFAYEAGQPTPLSDAQILYGFDFARKHAAGKTPIVPLPTVPPTPAPTPGVPTSPASRGFWNVILDILRALLGLSAEVPPQVKPTPQPVPAPSMGVVPPWYKSAMAEQGFHEVGVNRGIEKYIADAHTGQLGDPWCAIFVNAMLESSGIKGTRSAAARSFETSPNFEKLKYPAMGAIVTMWRGSPDAGTGHVFFYDGENERGIRGIGGNEDDGVRRAFHDANRVVGYFWPKGFQEPVQGKILVTDDSSVSKTET